MEDIKPQKQTHYSSYSPEKLPTKNDEESSLVDKRFEISNLDFIKDMVNIMNLEMVFTNKGKF